MAGTLWATPLDRQRIAKARSAAIMVGSYDGSGNYGDVLQFATSLATVRRIPGSPLPVAIVERDRLEHHTALLERNAAELGGAAFAFYQEADVGGDDGLVQLRDDLAPSRSAIYMYGGGYANRWWGGRKVAHAAAAERLAARRRLPVVASGLQVERSAVAPGGVAHELMSRASWAGARDVRSLEYMREALPLDPARIELTGDDATPRLCFGPAAADPVVNLHVNEGDWVSDRAGEMVERIVALLRELGRAFAAPLELQPAIAYEDPYVSEGRAVASLLERYGEALGGEGIRAANPVDLVEDATANGLGRFRRARLTVSCSYHVTLTSLLAGMPAVLLVDNDYYDQKAAGLRHLFELDDRLIGVRGTPADAVAAAQALVDGAPRTSLVEHLQARSAGVVDRYERGREAVEAALTAGLPRATLRDAIRRRLRGG
jgi:hypothetical protein